MSQQKTPLEKAAAQVLDLIENTQKPREQRELAAWITDNLKPEAVVSLSIDFDESESRFD